MTEQKQVIPEGYKQTEVGIIPEDWNICSLGELSERIMVGIASSATHAYRTKGISFLRNQNIKPNKLDPSDILFISEEYESGFTNKRLRTGDLLTARTGYPGTTCVVPECFDGAQSFTTLITRLKKEAIEPNFLTFYINSEKGQDFFTQNQIGGGQKNVNAATLKKLNVVIPSKKEQTAIANALSDVDALISELEKLIAKKQAIKTATMQQLLTGKTRLPEFALREDDTPKGYKTSDLGEIPEDWAVVFLAEIGQTIIGLTYSPNDVAEHGTLVLRSSNVQNNVLAYDNNVYVNMDLPERVVVKKGDILICVRNGSRQLIGKCALIDKNAAGSAFGAFMSIFRTKLFGFVFYQFQSDIIQNQINEIMGATINQITNKDMAGFRIPLPTLQKEQAAITSILSDMDEEIQSLQQRLNKTRQIKQGMMQELLTGKTRLVKPEVTA